MRRFAWVLLACALPGPATAGAASMFRIPWGEGPDQIGYYNHTRPGFDQPYAEGPAGIARGPGGEIWISDSMNHRISAFDRSGHRLRTLTRLGDQELRFPRALWLDRSGHLAVALGAEPAVLIGTTAGELRRKVGPETVPQLVQPEVLAGSGRELWVGDFGSSRLHRLGPDGEYVESLPWQLSGVALDGSGTLRTLESESVHVTDLTEPHLLGVDRRQDRYVRLVRPGSPPVHVVMVFPAGGGEPRTLGEAPVTSTIQQFAMDEDGGVLGLAFRADQAPGGAVEVLHWSVPGR